MMKWNKKGQMIILKIMLAVIILIMSMTFIAPLKESIGLSRNTSSSLNLVLQIYLLQLTQPV